MNLYKLHNTARRKMQRLSPEDKLTRKKFSIQYLEQLAETYKMCEFLEYDYCCRGEDHNCWIEVEGLDYGWLFLNKKEEDMPKILFDHALKILKAHRKDLYKRKIYVIENDDKISLFVFLRDKCRSDYIITFAKNPSADNVGYWG